MQKKWQVNKGGKETVRSLSELRQLLLSQRGLKNSQAESFFTPKLETSIHDPYLLYEMKEAVDRIYYAKEHNEHVLVYGDYDADGISSTAIMVSVLQKLGIKVSPFLPSRADDGYGLNKDVLKRLSDQMDLLISVDCGVTANEEVDWLNGKGIDVLIVDHHEPAKELPNARAIIHPNHPLGNYPFKYLCGAGASWKLAQALLSDSRSGFDEDENKWLLDLAAIGTIADMVPMLGENRAIAYFGMEIMKRTKRIGLRALLQSARIDLSSLSSEDLSFGVLPKINSVGRLADADPHYALDLLLADDEEKVEELIKRVNFFNRKRQTITRTVVDEAEQQVVNNMKGIIFAYDHSWPPGIVGLVAGRLADKFSLPAIVVGGNGDKAVGSARAPLSTNILEILQGAERHLMRLGGHAQAAGFTLSADKVNEFKEELQQEAATIKQLVDLKKADAIVSHQLLNKDTISLLNNFSPYGERNKRPTFIMQDISLVNWYPVGKTSDHAKFMFRVDDMSLDGIGFKLAKQLSKKMTGKVDVLGQLEENTFRGQVSLQINVQDIVPAGSVKIIMNNKE